MVEQPKSKGSGQHDWQPAVGSAVFDAGNIARVKARRTEPRSWLQFREVLSE